MAAFREQARVAHPDWFNRPVPTFGTPKARLLVVGLAPGLKGANRTGRPFTGDHAGLLLYRTLTDHGFAAGHYAERIDDGLCLIDCAITNAVRCVPPENKPSPDEIRTCRPFLAQTITAMPRLHAIVALGRIAHDSVLAALGIRPKTAPFAHGQRHDVWEGPNGALALFDSYHCSRYNTNTGVLTDTMFGAVFASVRAYLDMSALSRS